MFARTLIALSCSGLITAGAFAGEDAGRSCCAKKAKPSAEQPAAKMRCALTGKTVETCCCVERQGKKHCTLAEKDVETCCCKAVDEKKTS